MIISRKKYNAMRTELKGYYGGNETNEYFKLLSTYFRGIKLPPLTTLNREQIARAYASMAPVNGVVDYIADNVGEVMKYLELRQVADDGSITYFPDAPIMRLLRHPNDRFNLRRFGKAWAVNRLLFDDAWVYAPKAVGKDRTPQEMYVIPSQIVEVEEGGIAQPFDKIRLTKSIGKIEIEGNIMESFGYSLDPTGAFGTSKIVTAAVYLSILDKGMRRQSESLDNGGPATVITPKADALGVLPQEKAELEKEFNGSGTFNKIKSLRVPVDVQQIGSNPVDLNILASHKEAVTALCFVYHLPVDLYYGQSTYANMKEAKKAIYELQAIPLAEEFASDLLSYTGLDSGPNAYELRVNVDKIPIMRSAPSDALDNATKMHASLNELRRINGYDRIEEAYADQPMIPLGTQFGDEADVYDINENV